MTLFLRNPLAVLLGLVFVLFSPGHAASADEPPSVLDLPRIMQEQAIDRVRGVKLKEAGQQREALEVFERSVRRVPHDPLAHYHLACVQALLEQTEPALESLRSAIDCGFRVREALEKQPDLAALRTLPEYTALLVACAAPPLDEPPGWKYSMSVGKPDSGMLKLEPNHVMWSQPANALQVFADLQAAGEGKPVSGAGDAVGKQLAQWYGDGSAAGNVGDLYDNHDRGHSPLSPKLFPQLTHIQYGEAIKKRQFDNGLQRHFIYSDARLTPDTSDSAKPEAGDSSDEATGKTLTVERAVVLGNSSTALTGSVHWRSMPRLALTTPGGAHVMVQHYLNNHLYVYPEHRDHDPGHDAKSGWGDVFFANTPYYITTQGSSGTDQPFLKALASTLAAFPKDVKDRLRRSGLIAPTLQMIFRRCYRPVQSAEDYLSGIAHPTVFAGDQIDVDRMVRMAHSLKFAHVPPLVTLKVDSEFLGNPRKDYFDALPSEELLTTPFAIARAGFSTQYWREMQVSASAQGDVAGSQFTFHWVVLRGDPNRIEIQPVDGVPNSRLIRVGYHPRRPVAPGSSLESNRVDIGVFAFNGHYYSAPSFLSFYFPDNEVREYDDQNRIVSVDYVAAAGNYADTALVPKRDWRDEYHYSGDGALTGWTRIRGPQREEFDADGRILLASGSPEDASDPREVVYQRTSNLDGTQSVKQVVASGEQ